MKKLNGSIETVSTGLALDWNEIMGQAQLLFDSYLDVDFKHNPETKTIRNHNQLVRGNKGERKWHQILHQPH